MAPRQKSFDVSQALERATDLFWRRGYESSSISDLVAEMGISRQSLYDTFGDKHALLIAALDRYRQHYVDPVLAPMQQQDADLETVRAFLHRIASWGPSDPERRACFMVNIALERAPRDPDVEVRVQAFIDTQRSAFAHALAGARDKGQVPAELSAGAAADYLVATYQGIMALSRAGQPADTLLAIADRAVDSLKG